MTLQSAPRIKQVLRQNLERNTFQAPRSDAGTTGGVQRCPRCQSRSRSRSFSRPRLPLHLVLAALARWILRLSKRLRAQCFIGIGARCDPATGRLAAHYITARLGVRDSWINAWTENTSKDAANLKSLTKGQASIACKLLAHRGTQPKPVSAPIHVWRQDTTMPAPRDSTPAASAPGVPTQTSPDMEDALMFKSTVSKFVASTLFAVLAAAAVFGMPAQRASAQSAATYVNAVDLDIAPAEMDAFLAAIEENGAATVKEPGCRQFDILVEAKIRTTSFYEVYDNEGALTSASQSRSFQEICGHNQRDRHRTQRPRHAADRVQFQGPLALVRCLDTPPVSRHRGSRSKLTRR